MRKHGFYWRYVILPGGARQRFGLHRFRCASCRRTVSFLPEFCVPYKHFGADVIQAVLAAVLLVKLSCRAVAAWDSVYNRASFSRYSVGEWLQHFRDNSQNLWQFGLQRLGVTPGVGLRCCAALFVHLQRFGAGRSGCVEEGLRAVQCALSCAFPPFGLFRAQLLPGCCT
jgi:hypothetical protein